MGTAPMGATLPSPPRGALAVEGSVFGGGVCVWLWPWKYTWGEGQWEQHPQLKEKSRPKEGCQPEAGVVSTWQPASPVWD